MFALSSRDPNEQQLSNPSATEKQAANGVENEQGITEQRNPLFQQMDDGKDGYRKQNGAYVSPSDAIMSPASQKLASFKQKQINKQNNRKTTSRLLFARTSRSYSGVFDDVDVDSSQMKA
ncbi:hypothetical protein M433DRAFT_157224 [Acidomyces richmondensis BFW]|nr:MAG: hypothetical protein FE78DRAFT_92412 [Acidomyces sp. 'richmondensis']KYG43017.1 hypothetical protein M433DRAFT_157224 [Acidomyces richmondensis BFW]